ncbi:MAG: hypothetical protein AB1432_09430 [Bacteroidota bacterium]
MKVVKSFLAVNPVLRLFTSAITKLIVAILILIIFVNINSCNNITEPEILPGRRDYVWTRDTLRADKLGFQWLSGIWGSSPNDVWVVGDAATYVNKVWHFDGTKWKNYLLDQFAAPIQIHGVSSSEIWMVTTISDIWKYNGVKWSKDTTIVPQGYKRILFQDIYGYRYNIYAVGIAEKADGDYTGIIVHYNGSRWRILNTPQVKEYFINVMFLNNGDVLIGGINFLEPNESGRLYKLKGEKLMLIEKGSYEYRFGILNNKMYINSNRKVFEYQNDSLIEVLDLRGTDYAGGIMGRTIKDFFSANNGWNLGHYNGKDLINIYNAGGYIIESQIFDKEVFVICHSVNSPYYILHGKLN